MLVLTRKEGEAVVMGDVPGHQVRIVFLGMCKGQVRLGFEAPKEISICREELRSLQEENTIVVNSDKEQEDAHGEQAE